MLDDDDGVAHVAQALQGGDEAVVVAGVEADGGLVEDVEDAHQARPHLARQPDALGLAAGQRGGRSVERQVVQADVHQEAEPTADLLQQLLGDRPRDRVEGRRREFIDGSRGRIGQGVEERLRLADGACGEVDEGPPPHADGPGAGVEPRPAAFRARHAAHVGFEHRPRRRAARDLVAVEEVDGHPRPLLRVAPDLPLGLPVAHDRPIARPIQPDLAPAFVELRPRAPEHRAGRGAVGVGLEILRDRFEDVLAPFPDVLDRAQRRDRPVPHRERRIGDQEAGVEVVPNPQAVAGRAHPLRAVEAEQLRARRVEPDPARRAGEVRRQHQVGLALDRHDQRPLAQPEGLLHRLRQPPPRVLRRRRLQAVDDHLDVMLNLAVQPEVVGQRIDLAVDAGADVSGLGEIDEQVLVLPLLAARDRGEHAEGRAGGEVEDPGDDLLAGLGGDGAVAARAVALAHAGEEDAQVVVDLGDGPDGRTRVPTAGLLLDRDRG